jgi:hypothetical protein
MKICQAMVILLVIVYLFFVYDEEGVRWFLAANLKCQMGNRLTWQILNKGDGLD